MCLIIGPYPKSKEVLKLSMEIRTHADFLLNLTSTLYSIMFSFITWVWRSAEWPQTASPQPVHCICQEMHQGKLTGLWKQWSLLLRLAELRNISWSKLPSKMTVWGENPCHLPSAAYPNQVLSLPPPCLLTEAFCVACRESQLLKSILTLLAALWWAPMVNYSSCTFPTSVVHWPFHLGSVSLSYIGTWIWYYYLLSRGF